MNWEKILQLDAKGLHKNINLSFYAFLFYCLVVTANSFYESSKMVIPIRFKTDTSQKGTWKVSNDEVYTVTTSEFNKFELHIDTKGYPKELIISKLLELLHLFTIGFILLQVRGLSKSIVKKTPFEKANVSRLQKIGFSLLALYFIYPIFSRYLTTLAKERVTISGVELINKEYLDFSYAVVSLVFLLIAHVFKKGIELREENALTI